MKPTPEQVHLEMLETLRYVRDYMSQGIAIGAAVSPRADKIVIEKMNETILFAESLTPNMKE